MNIELTYMTGFGPTAWNHGGGPVVIPSMRHRHEQIAGRSSQEEPKRSDYIVNDQNLTYKERNGVAK